MPVLTIVTFTDADGDEFPIAVPGFTTNETNDSLEEQGRKQIQQLVDSGTWRPTMPLTLKSIERPE